LAMKKTRYIKGLLFNGRFRRKTVKGFVENRSNASKKNILVFCVITIVVMIVMNLCTAIRPLFENSADYQEIQEMETELVMPDFEMLQELLTFPIE